ncbi:bifunctional diguanylate cyclase/phosphodiesterase [Sphingomonas sp. OK281]|uniref:putative bifunctional diguanylate cyclase/phosphodiesterase n=1 Tax=Sphingomonas sp. OK281 TaxID=1881067 RepID=UPI0020C92580|nr:EAL domain-containing protein [Sphingomonas sp. OK281]
MAANVDLHEGICAAAFTDHPSDYAVHTAAYRCDPNAPSQSAEWLWLKLDASRLLSLPPRWNLLVDQTRFSEMAILVGDSRGLHRRTFNQRALQTHSAPGGLLRFSVTAGTRDVRVLYLGFKNIDDLSFMRKVVAVPEAEQGRIDARWLLLMGLFAGTMCSALLYNLVIHTGRRPPFQRWYLAWVTAAFAYGMVWTNVASYWFPSLVGPAAVRLDFILVGLMVAAGNMFFFAVIEDGVLPRVLRQAGHLLAISGAVLGFAAAADGVFSPILTDRLLNYAIAMTAVAVGVSCWIAVRRRSRVVWFYLIGWSPVITVFLARLARNLGLTEQKDGVDMATFAALAFEALVLSLAIADRFRLVRRELDAANQRQEIVRAEAKALHLAARTDHLTGIGNRSAFQSDAHGMISDGEPFSLFLIDVDYLKDTNDRLGHRGGDALLQRVAMSLRELTSEAPGVTIARIGGDEFAVLCLGDRTDEAKVIDRLGTMQGDVWRFMGHDRTISLSVGSARFPEDANALDALYQNADLALYNAKRRGRSCHSHYDALQRMLRDLHVELSRDAEGAIDRNEFLLQYQPIVSLRSGEISGYEALLRWNHPHYGFMRPDRFAEVLVAERIGLRVQEHVLELALLALRDHGDQMSVLSVNFTSAQLSGPRSANRVLDRLAFHRLSPSRLCVEVTEGVMLDRAGETILATLNMLHDAGVRVALDDFGTGYASLAHLRDMPVDTIKIDRSFVAGMHEDGGDTKAIVRAIIGLGQGLGKVVVAEGIETEAQSRELTELGCHSGQGYLYGSPASEPLPVGTSRIDLAHGRVMQSGSVRRFH